jgi:hypothetical protein
MTGAYSNTIALRCKIDLVYGGLDSIGRRIIDHPSGCIVYPEFLFTLHSLTRASVWLMQAALKQARLRAHADPVAVKLAAYLESHIPEEQGHDIWILEDLEAIGWRRSAIFSRNPSVIAASLIGAQYYWICHCHPVALLGYMELAEGYPPTMEMVNNLASRTGFPSEAFRALRRHAVLDIMHRDDLHRLLDSLPLSAMQQELMTLSAIHSIDLLAQLFDEILEKSAQNEPSVSTSFVAITA